ncbi:uncharacterized protein L969DRAFT_595953 [Mixia osmundae IAM 14324]|uniref:uncharacterized protein n=1 Tax=Mixia osmundae (strain CBS 9802 / IAM 14324 / JCM 22182 / KY 12970) TaxID=764103 RepID=UPI0004A54E13|nr:uncharacterized protein L969DRAFT_595953 [Mixia osmundae IAM 14324]KEI37695.1 hypothetical protein L969DRAFT_595953 [Mixia osmundae IAM 14324]
MCVYALREDARSLGGVSVVAPWARCRDCLRSHELPLPCNDGSHPLPSLSQLSSAVRAGRFPDNCSLASRECLPRWFPAGCLGDRQTRRAATAKLSRPTRMARQRCKSTGTSHARRRADPFYVRGRTCRSNLLQITRPRSQWIVCSDTST